MNNPPDRCCLLYQTKQRASRLTVVAEAETFDRQQCRASKVVVRTIERLSSESARVGECRLLVRTITLPNGQQGAYLRAYDKASGKEIGTGHPMPAGQTGTPMTYTANGRQYLVLGIGSGPYGAEFVAYATPVAARPRPAGTGGAQE